MSDPTYTFLPYARAGIAVQIAAADNDPHTLVRASLPIGVTVTGTTLAGGTTTQTVDHTVQLYGPGDVIGIDASAVIKTEPRAFTTSFEPNYLPYVECSDPDFPWRYTPAAANTAANRLRPWLALVVLANGEARPLPAGGAQPLPAFQLAAHLDATTLWGPAGELWAWAHVHINRAAASATDVAAAIAADADQVYARVVCPRRLAPNTSYQAFLVPAFETGRLAGLGQAVPATTIATAPAWGSGQAMFPIYFSWAFRTGAAGDFESLVRLLQPRPVDPRVGARPLDVLHPGSGLPPINAPASLGGTLPLGGALEVPINAMSVADRQAAVAIEQWDQPFPHPFEAAVAALVDLTEDYTRAAASAVNPDGDPDPVVTLPLYGRWPALAARLLTAADGTPLSDPQGWLHRANLDPRFRTAAGLGAQVVQANDQKYLAAAWAQVGDVLSANAVLRRAQLALAAATGLFARHVAAIAPERQFALTAPLHARVVAGTTTVAAQVKASTVPPALLSGAFRRATRPAAAVMRRLSLPADAPSRLASKLAAGKLHAAPPKIAPAGAMSTADALTFAKRHKDQLEDVQRPAAIAKLPHISNFAITAPGHTKTHAHRLGTDSADAARFKQGLRDVYRMTPIRYAAPAPAALDVGALAAAVVAAIDPAIAIPRRTAKLVNIPEWLATQQVQRFAPIMAYPTFDTPMYEPLVAQSSELFLPNLRIVPQNSLTLLEPNRRFIEAYLLGCNHEMARELLWAGYPTDQRGSYFRQFWDVTATLPPVPTPAERDALRDITPIHEWQASSALGAHDPRAGAQAGLVLVVRGDLLQRYPTAVIYAQRAAWQLDRHGQPDPTRDRVPVALDSNDEATPPLGKVLFPLYEAHVDPDVTFVGFALDPATARGGTGPSADPGWFFVIKERPGEPRFGMNEPIAGDPTRLVNWDDLTWAAAGVAPGAPITLAQTISLVPYVAATDLQNLPDPADAQARWTPATDAAQLAYILYRVPTLVAVHASRMLR